MEIIQIVSHLPPSIGGVADYVYMLARQLREAQGINTQFIVCDVNWQKAEKLKPEMLKSGLRSPASLDGFPVHPLREQNSAELLRVLSRPGMPQTVLLQYVGYGYEKRGCPVWLTRALREWKNGGWRSDVGRQKPNPISDASVSGFNFSAERRLVTMFHELYAVGPPWRSSFWTSPVQRWIAKSLACASDHLFTNRTASATWLAAASHHPTSGISVLPVISTVGEPAQPANWDERPSRLIVFGMASERRRVYFEHQADLENTCRAMNLNEIVDIGARFKIPQLSVRVSQRGVLPAQEVSQEMLAARVAFFAYPTSCLGKSTIFAAYAAHGLVPITFDGNEVENEDGLKCGEHYLCAGKLVGCDAEIIGKVGIGAGRWYQKHNMKAQARCYASFIQNPARVSEA